MRETRKRPASGINKTKRGEEERTFTHGYDGGDRLRGGDDGGGLGKTWSRREEFTMR